MSPYSVLPTLYGDPHCIANWRNVAVAIQCMSLISLYTTNLIYFKIIYTLDATKPCSMLQAAGKQTFFCLFKELRSLQF